MQFLFQITDISRIKRISFRNDINGLRAIAVLAVVFYHAELELFKGGWLGVDIFFVISGYLISNIIISELNAGTFSFKMFYLRRARRILPALFSTLLLTLPLAYFFLTPKAIESYIDSLIASVFFYANYHFMNLDFYVAESTKLMPLLHTWSLAIEEQFYLIFPLFVYFIYKIFRKYFVFFIVLITSGSLFLNSLNQTSEKFYLLEFRIWELLLGVIVMIVSNNLKIQHLEKIGFPIMLFPIFYYGDNWVNNIEPKLFALIGIALIIFSNTDSSLLTKVLSFKVISIIGVASYSIYLLHQPLFVFYRLFEKDVSINYKYLIMFSLFILGYFQYIQVEQKLKNFKNFKVAMMIMFSSILVFSYIGIMTNGYDFRYSNNQKSEKAIRFENLDYRRSYEIYLDNIRCSSNERDYGEQYQNVCVFNGSGSKNLILLSDSGLLTSSKYLVENLNYNNFYIFIDNISRCILFKNNEFDYCSEESFDKFVQFLAKKEIDTLVFYLRMPMYLDNTLPNGKNFYERKYLEKGLLDSNSKIYEFKERLNIIFTNFENVVIVLPIPSSIYNVPKSIYQNEVEKLNYDSNIWYKRVESSLVFYKEHFPNVDYFDVSKYFCNSIMNNLCVQTFDEYIYYVDDNHLSFEGVQLFIKDLVNFINKK